MGKTSDVDDFALAGEKVVAVETLAEEFFRGDVAALRDAQSKASQLVSRWLLWFRTEATQPPQCRIDLLVAHTGSGQASVWICEVSELGSSLCSVEAYPRTVA